ncbi:sulfotransferase [Cryomorphaceae bacterium]|nr:sulfotransferase [Cryomorphaceae bacterium]
MHTQGPTFLIIGAGKSGTTALHAYLDQHPDVYMSSVKETNFFALEGVDVKREGDQSEDQMEHYPWAITDRGEYLKLFEEAGKVSAKGETSPMYLYNEKAPVNIKAWNPEMKLIAILREPVDRLYSRYMHLVREHRAPSKDFMNCLDSNSIWWKRNDLVREGFYGTYIERYFNQFNPEQIKVFLYEDLRSDELRVIKEIYAFIGVDADFIPDTERQHNVSGKIKNPVVDALFGQRSILKRAIRSLAPGLVEKLRSSEGAQKMVQNIRSKNLEKAPLSPEDRRRIQEEVYASEMEKLSRLLNRDLGHWGY